MFCFWVMGIYWYKNWDIFCYQTIAEKILSVVFFCFFFLMKVSLIVHIYWCKPTFEFNEFPILIFWVVGLYLWKTDYFPTFCTITPKHFLQFSWSCLFQLKWFTSLFLDDRSYDGRNGRNSWQWRQLLPNGMANIVVQEFLHTFFFFF